MIHQSERTQVSQELSQKLKKSPLENKKEPDGKNAEARRSRLTSFKLETKIKGNSQQMKTTRKNCKMVSLRTARHPIMPSCSPASHL